MNSWLLVDRIRSKNVLLFPKQSPIQVQGQRGNKKERGVRKEGKVIKEKRRAKIAKKRCPQMSSFTENV